MNIDFCEGIHWVLVILLHLTTWWTLTPLGRSKFRGPQRTKYVYMSVFSSWRSRCKSYGGKFMHQQRPNRWGRRETDCVSDRIWWDACLNYSSEAPPHLHARIGVNLSMLPVEWSPHIKLYNNTLHELWVLHLNFSSLRSDAIVSPSAVKGLYELVIWMNEEEKKSITMKIKIWTFLFLWKMILLH